MGLRFLRSSVVSGGGGSNNDGVLTSYASMDLESQEIVRLDLSQAYPKNTDLGATYTYQATGASDGSPAGLWTPPTTGDGHAGPGGLEVDNGGTFTVQKLNFSFEMLFGSTYQLNYGLNDIKWIIVLTAKTLGGETVDRPMANWAHKDAQSDAVMAFCVGAGTNKHFNPGSTPGVYSGTPAYGPDGSEQFYIGATGGTYNSKPRIAPDTWLNCEFEVIAANAYGQTGGRIRGIVTQRSGGIVLTDISIPWNYDENWTLPNFIREIRVIGGYYNQAYDSVDANTYFKTAWVRIAANRAGLLGPRSGWAT